MSFDMNAAFDEEVGAEEEVSSDDRVGSIMDLEDEEEDYEADPDITDDDLNKDKSKPQNTKKKEAKVKDESSEEDDDEESEDEEDKEDEEEKPEGKTLKVKIDGEEVERFYSDEELASAISAKEASLKRFNEIDKRNKEIDKKDKEFSDKFEYVKKELHDTRGGFDKVIQDFKESKKVNGNPLTPIYNLLDKMGLDASQFDKAVLFHNIPVVAKFLDLSDEGKELFLTRHENEWHKKRQAANDLDVQRVAQHEAKLKEEYSKKSQAGLTDEDVQTYADELEGLGIKDVNLDKVIEWKELKPYYNRALNIAKLVGKEDSVNMLADLLIRFPGTTDEELLENLGFKKQREKEIGDKIKAKGKPSKRKEVKADYDGDVDDMFSEMFR